MPKLYAATFTVYFEAHDQQIAEKLAPLKCNRITSTLRKGSFIDDNTTVAVFNDGSVREVNAAEHKKALQWEPNKECWEDMSRQLINHLAGVYPFDQIFKNPTQGSFIFKT